jgi:hypothetical protein
LIVATSAAEAGSSCQQDNRSNQQWQNMEWILASHSAQSTAQQGVTVAQQSKEHADASGGD